MLKANLAIIAVRAFQFIVPNYYRLGKWNSGSLDLLFKEVTIFKVGIAHSVAAPLIAQGHWAVGRRLLLKPDHPTIAGRVLIENLLCKTEKTVLSTGCPSGRGLNRDFLEVAFPSSLLEF